MGFRDKSIIAIIISLLFICGLAIAQEKRFQFFGECLTAPSLWDESGWNLCKWNLIGDSLRLTWGTLKIHRTDTPTGDTSIIRDNLRAASNHNGLQIMVYDDDAHWNDYDFMANLRRGRRWLYHPECGLNYDRTGSVGDIEEVGNATTDVFSSTTNNVIHAYRNRTGSGYLAVGLNDPSISQHLGFPGVKYFRVRLKADPIGPLESEALKNMHLIVLELWDGNQTVSLPIIVNQIDSTLFVQSPSIPFNTQNPANYDFRIYWPGHVGVSVDYIAIDNEATDSLSFRSYCSIHNRLEYQHQDSLQSYLATFNTNSNFDGVYGFLMEGEIGNEGDDSLRFPVFGMVRDMVDQSLDRIDPSRREDLGSMSYKVCYTNDSTKTRRYLHDTGYPMLITDFYPFHGGDPPDDLYGCQYWISQMSLAYRNMSSAARREGKPWMSFVQVYANRQNNRPPCNTDSANWPREPTVREIAVQAHILAAMGPRE